MTATAHRAVLALGSNLGNRLDNLQGALRRLVPSVAVDQVSELYESDPVGPTGQPPYFNAVCAGATVLDPHSLLNAVKAIERALGRRPGPRWGPRPLDIDILLLDCVTLDTPLLTIPHPRLEERAFVLTPLADILPERVLPSSRVTVRDAAHRAGTAGLRRIAGGDWPSLPAAGDPGTRPTEHGA